MSIHICQPNLKASRFPYMSRALGFLAALLSLSLFLPMLAGAETATEEVSRIGSGVVTGFQWTAEAAAEEPGICFEVAVERNISRSRVSGEDNGRVQCSYPTRHRGILLTVANRHNEKEKPKIVAVGGAFSSAVAKVRIVRFDGSVDYRRTHRRLGSRISPVIQKFRYMTLAVSGPWCARTLTTLDSQGHELWTGGWKVFDASWWRAPGSNPSRLCPH